MFIKRIAKCNKYKGEGERETHTETETERTLMQALTMCRLVCHFPYEIIFLLPLDITHTDIHVPAVCTHLSRPPGGE